MLYDVIENRPLTEAVTTPTTPPTGTNLDTGIAAAIVAPLACFLVVVLILAAVLVYAYYPKCKQSVSRGRYRVKKSETDDPDLALSWAVLNFVL